MEDWFQNNGQWHAVAAAILIFVGLFVSIFVFGSILSFTPTNAQLQHARLRMIITEANKGGHLTAEEQATLDDAIANDLVRKETGLKGSIFYYTRFAEQELRTDRYPTTRSLAAEMAGVDPNKLSASTMI